MLVSNQKLEITKNGFLSYDKKINQKANPSVETYGFLIYAYDLINQKFFNNELPRCLITLQRKSRAYGYFSANRFYNVDSKDSTDEIALNPSILSLSQYEELLSTLAHEMCHLWQFHFSSNPKKKGKQSAYHDNEWAKKMEFGLGLMPSNTGKEGGKKTGTRMSDYIIKGGIFDQFCNELEKIDFKLKWKEFVGSKKLNINDDTIRIDGSKQKFTCPLCGQNAWAKLSAKIACAADKCNGVRMQLNAPNAP